MPLLPVVTTLLLTLIHAAAAHAERWTPPLRDAAPVREFDFDARTPFARGAHRGLRLAGTPGAVVRAPCSGRVTFRGRHPRLGPGLALRCGALVATEFGLERVPARQAAVLAGGAVGELGPRGVLYLGARRAGDRWGYLDPRRLLAAAPPLPSPLAPPPRPRRDLRRPPAAPRRPSRTRPSARPAPLVAWAGLAAAGVGAGAGVTLRRRRRRATGRYAGSGQPTH